MHIWKLIFEPHIGEIRRKAGQKMNALFRIAPYMNIEKRRTLLSTFFISQFNYCHLIWMSQSSKKQQTVFKRCLRVIYNDKISTFKEILLLEKYSSETLFSLSRNV